MVLPESVLRRPREAVRGHSLRLTVAPCTPSRDDTSVAVARPSNSAPASAHYTDSTETDRCIDPQTGDSEVATRRVGGGGHGGFPRDCGLPDTAGGSGRQLREDAGAARLFAGGMRRITFTRGVAHASRQGGSFSPHAHHLLRPAPAAAKRLAPAGTDYGCRACG